LKERVEVLGLEAFGAKTLLKVMQDVFQGLLLAGRDEMAMSALQRGVDSRAKAGTWINGLRETFDLAGVPIRILLRKGRNPYAGRADRSR